MQACEFLEGVLSRRRAYQSLLIDLGKPWLSCLCMVLEPCQRIPLSKVLCGMPVPCWRSGGPNVPQADFERYMLATGKMHSPVDGTKPSVSEQVQQLVVAHGLQIETGVFIAWCALS